MATAWQATWRSVCRHLPDMSVVHRDVTARQLRRPPRRGRRRATWAGIRRAVLGLAGTGLILAGPCFLWTAAHARPVEDVPGIAPTPTAEVAFAAPRRFTAIMEPATRLQRLYSVGDMIPDGKGSGGEYQILQIEEGRVQIGTPRGGKTIWVSVGGTVPSRAAWRVIGTPSLRMVEYRYVRTSGPLDAEPRVVELHDDHAYLEVDISPTVMASPPVGAAGRKMPTPAAPSGEGGRTFENTLLGRVRVKPTADDTYEISAADLNTAMEQSAQLMVEAWPKVRPSGYSQGGVSLDIQSPIADGTLGPRGFRVTSPNLAEQGGVQVGDLIVGVNGQPVNGFSDVYRVYSQMQRDTNLSVIQLDLVRQGRHLTKTYRIR